MSGIFAPEVGAAAAAVIVVAVTWLSFDGYRRKGVRNWEQVADKFEGSFSMDGPGGRWKIKGRFQDRPAFLIEDVSHEEAAAYHHTRGSLNISNPAHLIVGLRHKSMLEEVITRKDEAIVVVGVPDFDRQFFMVSNLPADFPSIFTIEIQNSLKQFSDVEIYVRSTSIEWRRAGRLKSAADIIRLFETISIMADQIAIMNTRDLDAAQRMAESEIITKSI